MWRWLRRVRCCPSDPSYTGPHEPEGENLLGSLGAYDRHLQGHFYGTSGTPTTRTQSSDAEGGTAPRYSPLSMTTPMTPTAFEYTTALNTPLSTSLAVSGRLPTLRQPSASSSPPSPPASTPEKLGAVSSGGDSVGAKRTAQPPTSLPTLTIPLPRPSGHLASGVKPHTPHGAPSAIDSGIELGATPALKGFDAHQLPPSLEHGSRGEHDSAPLPPQVPALTVALILLMEGNVLDDIPEVRPQAEQGDPIQPCPVSNRDEESDPPVVPEMAVSLSSTHLKNSADTRPEASNAPPVVSGTADSVAALPRGALEASPERAHAVPLPCSSQHKLGLQEDSASDYLIYPECSHTAAKPPPCPALRSPSPPIIPADTAPTAYPSKCGLGPDRTPEPRYVTDAAVDSANTLRTNSAGDAAAPTLPLLENSCERPTLNTVSKSCPPLGTTDACSPQPAQGHTDSHENDMGAVPSPSHTSLFTYPSTSNTEPPPAGTNFNVAYMAVIHAQGNAIVSPQINVYSDQGGLDEGWKTLQAHTAPNAIHTSQALSRVCRCDEGTRVKVLERMHEWAIPKGGTPLERVLCMVGAAGAGKSAIALTIAEQFSSRGVLAASFCFSSLDGTRNNCSRLIPTIAYQLGLTSESLRHSISEATQRNGPSIFQASLSVQLSTLVVDPIREQEGGPVPHIILIDGINECVKVEEQDQLIEVITDPTLMGAHPLCVIIVGRPEVAFHSALQKGGCLHGPHHILLSDDPDIQVDAAADIKKSLEIHLPERVGKNASELQEVIDAIVSASSGQYIYPATVLKYVSDGRRDSPWGRLTDVFSWINRAALKRPKSELDPLRALYELYANILAVAVDGYSSSPFGEGGKEKVPITLLLRAFASLRISAVCSAPAPEPEFVHGQLLGLERGHFGSLVCDLRSLVRVRKSDETGPVLQYYHRTFHEFLQDSRRVGQDLHVDQRRIGSYLVKRLCDTFVLSSDAAAMSIIANKGSFCEDETAWVNCTALSLLGDILLGSLKEKGKRNDTERTLKRFAKEQGWKKLQDWIDLARQHPQFAEAELVRSALEAWRPSLVFLKSRNGELATAAKEILSIMSTLDASAKPN